MNRGSQSERVARSADPSRVGGRHCDAASEQPHGGGARGQWAGQTHPRDPPRKALDLGDQKPWRLHGKFWSPVPTHVYTCGVCM